MLFAVINHLKDTQHTSSIQFPGIAEDVAADHHTKWQPVQAYF